MRVAILLVVTLALGFALGRFTSPRVNNEDGLIQIIAGQQVELKVAHELIDTLEREREELKAFADDRIL